MDLFSTRSRSWWLLPRLRFDRDKGRGARPWDLCTVLVSPLRAVTPRLSGAPGWITGPEGSFPQSTAVPCRVTSAVFHSFILSRRYLSIRDCSELEAQQ